MVLKLDRLRIAPRVALALALPMIGLLAASIWILSGYFRTAFEMERLRKLSELAPAVSLLIHSVQTERGLSASFLGSAGAVFSERLPVQYAETDTRRAELAVQLEALDAARFGGNLVSRVGLTHEMLSRLDTWRQTLAERRVTVQELTGYYGNLVLELIGIVEEMRLFSVDADLTKTISAYTTIMHAKELAGLERAVGAAGFAAGLFDGDSQARFIQLIERQRLHHEAFWLFATPEQSLLLDRAFLGFDAAELERMRLIVIRSPASVRESGVKLSHWFDTNTQKIDLLKTVEDGISAGFITQVKLAENSARQAAWRISVLAAVLLVLTAILATLLARGIIRPLARITNSMSKLAAQDGSIEIGDDQRGDEIGDMARALIVFRDNLFKVAQAEERMKNEAILRLHHEALGAISQGVFIADEQHRITYANPAFLRISGYSEAEVVGAKPSFLYGDGEVDAIVTELRDALVSGRQFHGHLRNYRKDGTQFWSDLSISPVLNNDGCPTHFVGVTRDITEKRLIQQELRIAATAFESLHGIMVTDADGIILRVNNAFTEITGYSATEIVGQTPAILKSGQHDPAFYADMWRQLLATGAWYGEIWDRRKNGEVFPKWQTISSVSGADERTTHYVVAFSDISESKAAEEKIKMLAFYDYLTQLPNRRLLLDRLQHALATSARNRSYGALLFIDLDNFKNLNDTYGHDQGDMLLQQVAGRLKECVRDGDTVARLGGDEFVLMLEDLGSKLPEAAAHTEVVGEKILETLNQSYQFDSHEFHSTPSIGATVFCGHDFSIEELLKQADLAMYQAKAAGRNALRFFLPDMQAAITARSVLEADLRKGLRDRQFVLYYQPQANKGDCLTGVEALLRWHHPLRGLVLPGEFISLTEDTGLILPLGLWVLETACAQLAAWAGDPATAHLSMAVNVSARQFNHADFIDQVLATLARTGADPHRLKLELTESLFLANVDETIARMTALKASGVSFSLDDFGTGYSSLSYLKRLPLDQLKIDRSFVKDLLTDSNDAAIAKMIVALGESMGLEVIAEGVETEEQRDFLARQGCHAYQGYLYSRPLPLEAFDAFVQRSCS